MPAAKPLPESKPKSTRGPTVTKLALRLSKILALLHQGDDIDKRWLAEKYKVSVRTIERDLSDRLHGIVEHTADGRWQLVPQQRSTIPARHLHDYTRMAGTAQLFPDRSLPYLLEQLDTPNPTVPRMCNPYRTKTCARKARHSPNCKLPWSSTANATLLTRARRATLNRTGSSTRTVCGTWPLKKPDGSKTSAWR